MKPIPEGEGAQINAMYAHLQTHTQTLQIRHVKECVCFLRMSNVFGRNVGGRVRRRENRCSDRQSGKQTGRERLLLNVISMQMTDKELRPRRMETVTTATDVAVATEIS